VLTLQTVQATLKLQQKQKVNLPPEFNMEAHQSIFLIGSFIHIQIKNNALYIARHHTLGKRMKQRFFAAAKTTLLITMQTILSQLWHGQAITATSYSNSSETEAGRDQLFMFNSRHLLIPCGSAHWSISMRMFIIGLRFLKELELTSLRNRLFTLSVVTYGISTLVAKVNMLTY
jgi:hypothetical protein